MQILLHDYGGHPFPAQLSRALAGRGNEVLHVYSNSVISPQGALDGTPSVFGNLRFLALELNEVVDRRASLKRFFQERAYGKLLAGEIRRFRPSIVVSANAPLESQSFALRASRDTHARFVFWLQDIHGFAVERLLGARLGLAGRLVGKRFARVERRLLRASDAVVAISEDFVGPLRAWGIEDARIAVIENWASTQELPWRPRDNSWGRVQGLTGKFCFLYSGTLGMKHNPYLLLQLALHYRIDEDVRVVVISEGAGAMWLAQKGKELNLTNLMVLPFQPYAQLPDVMGSADVLVAILEQDASVFSVPSKVLSYLCAGRALLLAVPDDNLSARTIQRAGAGFVTSPGDVPAFLQKADTLKNDPTLCREMAGNALRYAREQFNLEEITNKFEAVFKVACRGKGK